MAVQFNTSTATKGLAYFDGADARATTRRGRAALNGDPAAAAAIRGIVDQLMMSEWHVGVDSQGVVRNASGDAIATFANDQSVTFAGAVVVTGDLTVNGTTTTVNSTTVQIDDNIQVVNSGPSGSKNAGYAVERYQVANNAGSGDVVGDSGALVETIADIGDQTGQDSTHIYLGAGASATDSYYVGLWIMSAFGDNRNVRKITAYNGTTKIATVATAWDTQPSSNTSVGIYTAFQAVMFDETNNVWRFVTLTANDVVVGNAAVTFGDINVANLNASTGITSPYIKASGGDFTVAGGNGSGGLLFKTNGSTGTLKLDIDHSDGLIVHDHVTPGADSSYNLGSTSAAFATAYVDTVTTLTANDRIKLGTDAQVLLSLPVFTTQQITDNIAAPAAGDLVYDSTTGTLKYRSAADWVSLASAGDTSGLTGTTNLSYTINSDVANEDGNASLVLQSGNGADATSAGTLTYVYGAGADGGIWSYGAHVRVADDKQLKLGTDSDVTMAFVSGSSLFDINVTGAVELDASGAVSIESSAGALNFGADDVDQAVNVGTDGERTVTVGSVNGAAALNLRAGTGTITVTAGGALDMNVTGAATLDAASFSIDATTASNVSVTGADLTISTLTSGTLALSSAGAATLDAASSVTIGGTNATSLDLGRSGQMTTVKGTFNVDGAASFDSTVEFLDGLIFSVGGGNSATNAPSATNQVVAAISDGLTKADAAGIATALARGAYASAGKVKRGVVTLAKMATNVGGTTFDNMAIGDRVYLAAAIASEYDSGVTPAKGTITTRTPFTADSVVYQVGIVNAASDANTSTVAVEWFPHLYRING